MNIIPFWRVNEPFGEFSNWYIHPDFIRMTDDDFLCVEQEMMMAKAMTFGDEETGMKILAAKNPREMKDLGRQVKNFDPALWDRLKYGFVFAACAKKFSDHEDLQDLLLGTGDAILVEASPYDAVWGIGMSKDDPNFLNQALWGQNLLGQVLMDIRTVLNNVSD